MLCRKTCARWLSCCVNSAPLTCTGLPARSPPRSSRSLSFLKEFSCLYSRVSRAVLANCVARSSPSANSKCSGKPRVLTAVSVRQQRGKAEPSNFSYARSVRSSRFPVVSFFHSLSQCTLRRTLLPKCARDQAPVLPSVHHPNCSLPRESVAPVAQFEYDVVSTPFAL